MTRYDVITTLRDTFAVRVDEKHDVVIRRTGEGIVVEVFDLPYSVGRTPDSPAQTLECEDPSKLRKYMNLSVVHGTQQARDLLPCFLRCLEGLDKGEYRKFEKCSLPESDDDPWWGSEECSEYVREIADILDILAAPAGYYFGAHPGDGSEFGFWESEE